LDATYCASQCWAPAGSRQLERPANDSWLKDFLMKRGTQITQALVLSNDRWKDNVYTLLLSELGAIFRNSSTKHLADGEQMKIQSMHFSLILFKK
jgi:hypothetical protein